MEQIKDLDKILEEIKQLDDHDEYSKVFKLIKHTGIK